MSLINDALKRAKKSQQPDPPAGAPPLPPIEPEAHDGVSRMFPILVFLLVAVAAVFIALAMFTRKPATEIATAPPPVQVAPVLPKAPPVPVAETNEPVAPQPPEPPPLRLQGIFYNTARPQAIVNGTTVYEGDVVDGFRVKLISQNSVSFITTNGTEKTLALSE
jgi:hypothetical protein